MTIDRIENPRRFDDAAALVFVLVKPDRATGLQVVLTPADIEMNPARDSHLQEMPG